MNYRPDLSDKTLFPTQPLGLSHLTVWLQNFNDQNPWNEYNWDTQLFLRAADWNITPVIYGYLVAGKGHAEGLSDCDNGGNNLCIKGSNIIRDPVKWQSILDKYTYYLDNMLKFWPSTRDIVFLIEPDWIQYSVTGSNASSLDQEGGGIPDADLFVKWKEIKARIKAKYPNAKIGLDVSPWLNDKLKTWFELYGEEYDLTFVAGGRTSPVTDRIRLDSSNDVTWSDVYAWTNGRPILPDIGYGVAGQGADDNISTWHDINVISVRNKNGVIGITTQRDPGQFQWHYENMIKPVYERACALPSRLNVAQLQISAVLKSGQTISSMKTAFAAIATSPAIVDSCLHRITKAEVDSSVSGGVKIEFIVDNNALCTTIANWKNDSDFSKFVVVNSAVVDGGDGGDGDGGDVDDGNFYYWQLAIQIEVAK